MVALKDLPGGVPRGVVPAQAVVQHRRSPRPPRRPALPGRVRSPSGAVAWINSEASCSRPCQAASIIAAYPVGGLPVASAIRRSSSISCSAALSSPASRWMQAEEVERELQLDEGAHVTGDLNLADGQGMPGLEVPQLQRDDGCWLSRWPARASARASPASASRVTSSSSARVSAGAAAAYPSVNRSANASSSTSTARGGSGPGGAARAASAASRTPPGRPRSPANIAARIASRYVSRARAASSGSRSRAARQQQPGRVAAATLVGGDLPAQALHLGGLQRVQRPGLGRDQQPQRRIQRRRPPVWPGPRRAAAAPGAPGRGSAAPPAPRTRPPRPARRGPAPGPRTAPAPPRRPHPAPARPGPGARPGDRDQPPGR